VSALVVARNYAEALALLAQRQGGGAVESYGTTLDLVAGAIEADPTITSVLLSPRVSKAAKRGVIERALAGVADPPFVRWLTAVVARDRQGLLPLMSAAYQGIVDQKLGRVHAGVVTAHDVDEALARTIAERLRAVVGKVVVPHFRTDRALLGGLVVRIGDRVFDGSLRRRMRLLRHQMLHPRPGTATAE